MKIIQTLYTGNQNLLNTHFGWCTPIYHIMGWVLSCLTLRSHHDKVILYTDPNGYKLLIEHLNLPYTSVNLRFSNWNPPYKSLWALPKILTYAEQTEPFLHIDGDVFINCNISELVNFDGLVAQHEEGYGMYYQLMEQDIIKNLPYIPSVVKNNFLSDTQNKKAVNAGVLGGTDICFFKQYTRLAIDYIYKNIKFLPMIDLPRFNVIFEQHLFYVMAHEQNKKINYLFNSEYDKDTQMSHIDFMSFNKNKYIHMLGNYKRNELCCMQMAMYLKFHFPDYFNKVESLFLSHKKSPYLEYEEKK